MSLLNRAARFTNISIEKIKGKFSVNTSIQAKSGLGSSAAICINIANVFKHLGFWNDAFSLAKYLEDQFHHKSSGLDIAIAMTNKPIVFQNNKINSILEISFWPHLMLTYSGETSTTSECTDTVMNVFYSNSSLADELDAMMNHASALCESGLKNGNFNQLKEGIALGNETFKGWGLHNDALSSHINTLINDGAAAAKPIGSGLGGYVLSLWERKPDKYNDICLTLDKP
jgi:mevalonate kinase